MATWNNIFDLGEWQIYIRYAGVDTEPDPNSREYWVKAEDLSPDVGSMSVVDGEIVCDMGDMSGSGGMEISIIAVPIDWTPPTAFARVSASYDEGAESFPFEGGSGENDAINVGSTAGMVQVSGPTYGPDAGTVQETVGEGVIVDAYEFADQVPGGEGLVIAKNYGGF